MMPQYYEASVDMNLVASIILGGGEGKRLFPLTLSRCKPAISFGGKYRLIDIPVSNSINAGCNKIFLLTQFLSASLHRHIFHTYQQSRLPLGFIEILSAEQKPNTKSWYQGTADAVRQNIDYFINTPVDYFLILSGDQLYNLDFRHMLRFAKKTNADVVIAALPISGEKASRMGVLKINDDDFVTDFYEKPQTDEILQRFRSPDHILAKVGSGHDEKRPYLGSMGIYLFKRQALIDLLVEDPREDFGKHLLPTQVKKGGLAAFLYDGFWEDIGTISSFYQANMDLMERKPPFDLYGFEHPLHSCQVDAPPAKIFNAEIHQSILSEGVIVEDCTIKNSLLGPRAVVKKGTLIHNSYIIGNDYYAPPLRRPKKFPKNLHIGEDCFITKAIIDKHACIGNGVKLINEKNLINYDGDNIFIRDGIIIVPTETTIPDGFVL